MKKLFFLIIIFCLGSNKILAQDITFRASSEKTVVVNQQFRVSYTLSTIGQEGKNLQLGDIKNFDVLYGPVLSQSSSTSFINGKVSSSSSSSFTYVFMAKSEGTFTIPPATIVVGNSTYKSNELTVNVLPADKAAAAASQNNNADQAGQQQQTSGASASDKDLFVVMHVSKNSVYENEGFLVTFKLYSLIDVTGFENAKFPEFEGFISQEIDLGTNTQMNLEPYNGRNYRTAIIKQTILFPQRSGKITIGSGKFDVVARIRSQQKVRSFFDDFFDTYSDVKKTLISAPVTIDVKPLPTAGRPASFSGAVGNYTMTSSINSQNVKTNDAVTIKVAISGTGNIKLIKNPEIVFPNDFEVYDPTVDVKPKVTQSGVSGTKSIEYNAIPRYAGDFTIPKAEFSYFDLNTGTYKTLATDEFKLHVAQGAAGTGTAPIVNATNKEDIRFLGKDILYIKTDNYNFHKGSFFFGTFGYYLWYIIPALLFIVLFIIYRKQAAENANIALVRTKKANKVAAKRLKMAAKYLNDNKKEAFYDETLRAVWGYLSDKLNIPVSALTKENVEANLTQYGADENLINDFRNILNTAEFARFAPAQGSGTMSELYNSTVQAIDKMENTIKKIKD